MTVDSEAPTIKVDPLALDGEPTLIVLNEEDLIHLEGPAEESPAGAMMLIVKLPNRKALRYGPFSDQEDPPRILIGRTARCHIQIDHKEVSRIHAELTYQNGEFLLLDNNSSGGIFHQGMRIFSLRLQDEMEVDLASCIRLKFLLRPAPKPGKIG